MGFLIIAEALKVKAFLNEDPKRTYLHVSQHFKVTKARISQLMKIAEVLPQDFVDYIGRRVGGYILGRTAEKIKGGIMNS